MRIAFLADIHGNLPALEAVMVDLQQQRPDQVYLVGDQVNRCPWNNEILEIVTELGWPAIHGNHDLVVSWINTPQNRPPFTEEEAFPTLWWTQRTLDDSHLTTIRNWPAQRTIETVDAPTIRLFHGIPENSFVGILPEESDERIATWLAPIEEPIIVCGHTHRPLARQVGRHSIYNGGSVGIPYNSDPSAQYLLLDAKDGTWHPTWRRIAYDHSPIPTAFTASGLDAIAGPIAELHLRTIMSAEPWISDFGYWLRFQPPEIQRDKREAVAHYLAQHGPGHWAFGRVLGG